MIKISTNSLLKAFVTSSLIGVGLTALTLVMFWPIEEKQQPLSVLNYENIDVAKGEIVFRGSPFLSGDNNLMAPSLPVMPDQELLESDTTGRLMVLGVIEPDIAIISKGGTVITARAGEETACGVIDYVARTGASVNGRFINLK